VKLFVNYFFQRGTIERGAASQAMEKHRAEGIKVALQGRLFALEAFRSKVKRRSVQPIHRQ